MLMLHKIHTQMAYKIRADNSVWNLNSINSMSIMNPRIIFSLHILCTHEVCNNRSK